MQIEGLEIYRGVLEESCDGKACDECCACLLREINAQPWNKELKRLTQHYGRRYVYQTSSLEPAPPMPPLIARAGGDEWDQCIVNRYTRGQRITRHIDHQRLFGPRIMTLSLGTPATMRFTRAGHPALDVELRGGDVVILHGDARYEWAHELLALPAGERTSVTYRTLARP
jgi:alkylated DNA repair dioxygenase AlkB